jgi:hypothetical protein
LVSTLSICVTAAGKTVVLAASAFTLSWSHSVEKTRWEEDWRLTPAGLELVEARVKGSGAGMEPPDGAVLEDGWWMFRPDLPPQPSLLLAASGATGSGWSLCAEGDCLTVGATPGGPVEVRACSSGDQ